jgi:predicted GH43/DUF377 family glycosyl hydrolase
MTDTTKLAAMTLLLIAAALLATGAALGETHTWNNEADFEDGEFDATVWDKAEDGVTLTGGDTLWKYRGNPLIGEGAATTWDDTGVYDPCVVFAKGKYYVYYSGYSGTNYAIGLYTATDGTSFSPYGSNPVLSQGGVGKPDATGVHDPFVIYEDGTFKMWYTGNNGGVYSICYATSTDGTTWTKKDPANVLNQPGSGWGSVYFGDPCVVKFEGTYWMFLSGSSVANNELVGLATSTDGVSWTLYSSNPIMSKAPTGEFGQQEIKDVAVYRDDEIWRMFFTGRDSGAEKYRIGRAWSFDGLKWFRDPKEVLKLGAAFDTSQVNSPGVIWDDGTLFMYYHGDNGGGTPTDAIGLVQLKNWYLKDTGNPMVGTGATYDSTHLQDPCVFLNQVNGVYYMYYGCYGGSGTYPYSIHRATSNDGKTWTRVGGKALFPPSSTGGDWNDEQVADPSVIFENGIYKMWFSGYDGSMWKIGYATSTDGAYWTNATGNPIFSNGSSVSWDGGGVKMPWVLKVGSTYHMWYIGYTTAGGEHIGHATSTDGVSWTRDTNNPVMTTDPTIGWEDKGLLQPCVLYENGQFVMYYTGKTGSDVRSIGVAYSDDGVAWLRDSRNPVIDRGNSSAWDVNDVSGGSVRFDGSFHHMYFAGNSSTAWRVGYATWDANNKGHYTTPILDVSQLWPIQWNAISWDEDVPLGTTIMFQIATNTGGSIWEFVGPDGKQDSFYETNGQGIYQFQSGSRMRIRVYFTTQDEKQWVPILRSLTVSYQQRLVSDPPTVVVKSPNGGEDWMKTKAYPIIWKATGNLGDTSVSLEYSTDNGTTWTSIATAKPNTGFYKWTVPSTETSGAMIRVTVTDIDGQEVVDTSDATFAIDPPPPKSGAFIAPSAGSVLAPGRTDASWVVNDPWGLADRPLTLELSTDGGLTWSLVVDAMALTDTYSWEVPDLDQSSELCVLRLSVLSWLGDISVIESGVFTIDIRPPAVSFSMADTTFTTGSDVTVTATAMDDVALQGVTLYVAGSDGIARRTYEMVLDEDTWSVSILPLIGDEVLWVTASDGVYEVRTDDVLIEVTEAATDDGDEGMPIAVPIVAAVLLAVCAVAVLWSASRRSGR